MSDTGSFKKPAGFTPFFVAKLTQKKKLFWPCVILLFFIFGANNAFLEGDSDVVGLLIIVMFCAAYILYARYLNKNPNIIEVSDKGIWLPLRRIFIPKDRFYKAIKVQRISHSQVGDMTIQNVDVFFKISRNERRSLFWRLVATKKEYEISPTQYQVTVSIPYTVGHGDDILLNVSKTELVRILNSLKSKP